jgi:small subunit ribosomal protein S20
MNKKQRNRKIVKQNKRNRIINRRYSSTIKSLSKLFIIKLKQSSSQTESQKILLKKELFDLVTNIYSIVDKAVKKGVIHQNTAARKKSRIAKLNVIS